VTAGRALAWILLITSIALGSGTSAGSGRVAPRVGPYTVLAADFHVHSFPGDGGLLPWDIVTEARRRGLDAIALTSHNNMWSWRLARRSPIPVPRSPIPVPRSPFPDVIVLPGVELTSAGYHMTTIDVQRPVAWRQSPAQAAAAAHAQGGIAIAAHPRSPHRSKWDDEAIDVIDGFEAASSNDSVAENAAFSRRALVRRPSLAAIGASDFHYFAPLGVSRTFVFVTERSAAGLLDAVRRGRTVACDGLGHTSGPAELASAVSDECRRAAIGDPIGWRWRDGVSTSAAWLSLLALVMIGARERDAVPADSP
jgi:hypothetical protein